MKASLPPEWLTVTAEGEDTLALTFRNPTEAPITFGGEMCVCVGSRWTKLRGKPIPDRRSMSFNSLPLRDFTLAPGGQRTLRAVALSGSKPKGKAYASLGGSVHVGEHQLTLVGSAPLKGATSSRLVWEDAVLRLAGPAPEGEPTPPPLPKGVMELTWEQYASDLWRLKAKTSPAFSALRFAAADRPIVLSGKQQLANPWTPKQKEALIDRYRPLMLCEDNPSNLTLRGRVILPDGRTFTLPERPPIARPKE